MSIKQQVFSAVKWTTFSGFTVTAASMARLFILARIIEKSDFGLMALVTSVMGLMHLISDLGLGPAILHKKDISLREYAGLYWMNWFMSAAMYLFLLALTPLVAVFFGEEELYYLLPLAGLALISSGLGSHFKIFEQKQLRFQMIAVTEMASALASLVIAVILAREGFGVYALVYSFLAHSIISNVLYFVAGIRKRRLIFSFSWPLIRPFLRIGGFHVSGQIVNIFNKELDVLLIGKFFSAEVLGIYSLARQLVQKPVSVIMPVIVRVGTPALAGFNDDAAKVKKYFLRIVRMVSLFSLPTYTGLMFFAEVVIRSVYGEGFEGMVTVFRILCLYMILRNPLSPVGILTTATGRTDLEFKWNLLTLFITPVFIFIGTGYNIEGVALALTVNMALLFVPFWAFLVRRCSFVSLEEYAAAVFLPFWKVKT